MPETDSEAKSDQNTAIRTALVDADAQKLTDLHTPLSYSDALRELLSLTPDERHAILRLVPSELAADLVEEAPGEMAADLVERLKPDRAAEILEELGSDVQADVIGEMEDEDANAVLSEMSPEDAEDACRLPVRTARLRLEGARGDASAGLLKGVRRPRR